MTKDDLRSMYYQAMEIIYTGVSGEELSIDLLIALDHFAAKYEESYPEDKIVLEDGNG